MNKLELGQKSGLNFSHFLEPMITLWSVRTWWVATLATFRGALFVTRKARCWNVNCCIIGYTTFCLMLQVLHGTHMCFMMMTSSYGNNCRRYWPYVRGIHGSLVDSPHKGQWRGALIFSLIWVWRNGWTNSQDAGGLRHHFAHWDVTVLLQFVLIIAEITFYEKSSVLRSHERHDHRTFCSDNIVQSIQTK